VPQCPIASDANVGGRSGSSRCHGDVTHGYCNKCNSLLVGCGVKVIARLQRVQNNAARLVCECDHAASWISLCTAATPTPLVIYP